MRAISVLPSCLLLGLCVAKAPASADVLQPWKNAAFTGGASSKHHVM